MHITSCHSLLSALHGSHLSQKPEAAQGCSQCWCGLTLRGPALLTSRMGLLTCLLAAFHPNAFAPVFFLPGTLPAAISVAYTLLVQLALEAPALTPVIPTCCSHAPSLSPWAWSTPTKVLSGLASLPLTGT